MTGFGGAMVDGNRQGKGRWPGTGKARGGGSEIWGLRDNKGQNEEEGFGDFGFFVLFFILFYFIKILIVIMKL